MTSNYSTNDVEKENKGHIQMISNHTTINVEKKTKGKQNVNIVSNQM